MTEFQFRTSEEALMYLRNEGFKPIREYNWIDFPGKRAAAVKPELDCIRVVVIHP